MTKDLLEVLNEEQREAALTIEGPVLVLAGAGSGKTRVVTYRIAHLIQMGIPAATILGLTFTNKAAGEMRERITNLTQHHVLISTFHSLGARILRESIHVLGYENNFTIYDDDDSDRLLKTCLEEVGVDEIKPALKSLKYLISTAKNNGQGPDQIDDRYFKDEYEKLFPAIYELYQRKLKEYNAVDFDDLLYLTVKLWREHPSVLAYYQSKWHFVHIDEYQDTNMSQYAMIKLLVAKRGNIFVVGDPDQSIYAWRGANIRNILNFEKDYPGTKVIRLEQNYRSYTNILDAANELIQHNEGRYEKNLWSARGAGEKIKLHVGENERVEAEFVAQEVSEHHRQGIPFNQMAVFYRTNAQSRPFEDYLAYERIPYVIVGGISFYQRREIKDILAFLRLVQSSADFISFARTINLPKRGLGESTIEKLRAGATEEGLTILTYCKALVEGKPLKTTLKLSAKQKQALSGYLEIIYQLRDIASYGIIVDVVKAAIEKTGYLSYLLLEKDTYADRKENLDELIAKAIEWESTRPNDTLSAFLEELSLKSNLDEASEEADRLSLMTIHNGKGLEFKITFMVGLEEDLFPHINSKGSPEQVEEERRLCYVGMTRAKDWLYLSYCFTRYMWGNLKFQHPSRFLDEIPSKYIERIEQKEPSESYSYLRPLKSKADFERPSIEPKVPHDRIESTEEFGIGDTIFHQEFGIGQIKEAYQAQLGLTYKIFFIKDSSLKTLVAKYASLKRL